MSWKEQLTELLQADISSEWTDITRFWETARGDLMKWVLESNNLTEEGDVVEAAEFWAAHPFALQLVNLGASLDRALGIEDSRFPSLQFDRSALQPAPDGPIYTAYRFALRTGERKLVLRSERLIKFLDPATPIAEDVEAWAKAVIAHANALTEEASTQALLIATRQAKLRRTALTTIAALVVFGLLVSALYVRDRGVYQTIIASSPDDEGSPPRAYLPPSLFPGIPEALAARHDSAARKNAARNEALSILESLQRALSSAQPYAEKHALFLENEAAFQKAIAPFTIRESSDLADAFSRLRESYLDQKQHARDGIIEAKQQRLDALKNALAPFSEQASIPLWQRNLPKLRSSISEARAWSPPALFPELAWTPAETAQIQAAHDQSSLFEQLISSTLEAREQLAKASDTDSVRGALSQLQRIARAGARFPVAQNAARSLSLWEAASRQSLADLHSAEDQTLLQQTENWQLDDTRTMASVGAAHISSLLNESQLANIHQYFLNSYRAGRESVITYVAGEVATEETVIDNLRQITLISQTAAVWNGSGFETLRFTANRDGLGRLRGTLLEDGFLTPEARFIRRMAEIWNRETRSWSASPLPLLQEGIYDSRLTPAFRLYLVQWAGRAFIGQQSFMLLELQPDWTQLIRTLKDVEISLTPTIWMDPNLAQNNLRTMLGNSTPAESWSARQARLLEKARQLREQQFQLNGLVINENRHHFNAPTPGAVAYTLTDPSRAPVRLDLAELDADTAYPLFHLILNPE